MDADIHTINARKKTREEISINFKQNTDINNKGVIKIIEVEQVSYLKFKF